MKGKITLEEAYLTPELLARYSKTNEGLYSSPESTQKLNKALVDITGDRLKSFDEFGVGYAVFSLSLPGIQGIWDPKDAEAEATKANDWIANQIKDHRDRMGAFACLSMHDPKQAGEELRRCITEYGFHGALLNDIQHAGEGGTDYLYYDQPEYDPFWEVVQELDVPVYIHPAAPADITLEKLYKGREYLVGPALSFGNGVSRHLLGIISNGVFDRFPKLKIIVGHLGEKLPIDFWRIDFWFETNQKPNGMVAKKRLAEYFNENIWVTTSSNFSSPALDFCINQLGADRIMFSVDTPYVTCDDGCTWFDNHAFGLGDKIKIGRTNAKEVLKIGDYLDQDAPVHE